MALRRGWGSNKGLLKSLKTTFRRVIKPEKLTLLTTLFILRMFVAFVLVLAFHYHSEFWVGILIDELAMMVLKAAFRILF